MNTRLRLSNIWRSGLVSGLALVEVVAGLALMGTLLVVAIIASTGQTRQLRQVARKEAAVQLLDRFLTEWSAEEFHGK